MLVVLLLFGLCFTTVIASADRRNKIQLAAKARSPKAISKLETAVVAGQAQLEALANLADVVIYQGQWLKVFPNPTSNWFSGASVCDDYGGVPATALSKQLMLKIKPIIPIGKEENGWKSEVVIGLKRKLGQENPSLGWQWIDHSSQNAIDIDKGNTVRPMWGKGEPNNDEGKEHYGAIKNSDKYGYGVNDEKLENELIQFVLCQFAYPKYKFKRAKVGVRMIFPQEYTVTGVGFDDCVASCIESAFCRAFSYSAELSDCRHHSSPPDDREATTKNDTKYNIYA